jgi:AraC-like DNA-binding protein
MKEEQSKLQFPKVDTSKIFICVDPRPATELELYQGQPQIIPGYWHTGNTFIDHLMPIVHKYGCRTIAFYANLLGVSINDLNGTLKVLTGLSTSIFLENYALQMAQYLLENTNMKIEAIAKRCGYSREGLYLAYQRRFKKAPSYDR